SKMDLEACVGLPDGRLVAFGSGSNSARETLVVWTPGGHAELVHAAELYARWRVPAFAGSELNLEGAVVAAGGLLLFQRGNGERTGRLAPGNAIGGLGLDAFVAWRDTRARLPELLWIVPVELGSVGG